MGTFTAPGGCCEPYFEAARWLLQSLAVDHHVYRTTMTCAAAVNDAVVEMECRRAHMLLMEHGIATDVEGARRLASSAPRGDRTADDGGGFMRTATLPSLSTRQGLSENVLSRSRQLCREIEATLGASSSSCHREAVR